MLVRCRSLPPLHAAIIAFQCITSVMRAMADKAPIRDSEGGSVVALEVHPNASETEVGGINSWRGTLRMRVAAQAREGAANEELTRYLSEELGVPRASIRIVKGLSSQEKSVFVPLPAEEVRRRLGV